MNTSDKISWGCRSLDNLTGGIERGVVTVVHGFSSVGKTTMSAHQPIARILSEIGKPRENQVFVVTDTDGGFSLTRLRQVCLAHGVPNEVIEEVIRKHLIYRTFYSFQEQHEFWTGSDKESLHGLIKQKKEPLLIVNDAATVIYRNIILKLDSRYKMVGMQPYLGKLGDQAINMMEIAKTFDCPAFMVSYTSSEAGQAFVEMDRPIGGRTVKEIAKTIIRIRFPTKRIRVQNEEKEIEDTDYQGRDRVVVLQKHRDKPIGDKVIVVLGNKGFEDPS